MKNILKYVSILFLGVLLLGSTNYNSNLINKSSDCKYLQNKAKTSCPYSSKQKIKESKNKCPFSNGKEKTKFIRVKLIKEELS